MAVIASGIVESKNFIVLALCCKLAGWALPLANGVWNFHSLALLSRSWLVLQWVLWLQRPTYNGGQLRAF